MTREISYKLGPYKIIEGIGGGLWWESHSGVGAAKTGRCYLEGSILILGPSETEKPGFLKTEFMEHLDKLPRWEKTEYYCLSRSLYRCRSRGNLSLSSNLGEGIDLSLKSMKNDAIKKAVRTRQKGPRQLDVMKIIAHVKGKTTETWHLLKRLRSKNRH
jgi:hypothetical protein